MMVTNQISRRNHNRILFIMLVFCCMCPDFGLCRPSYTLDKRQMVENRIQQEVLQEGQVPARTSYINPISEKCTLFTLGKRKEAFENENICNQTKILGQLNTQISIALCKTNQLMKDLKDSRNFTSHKHAQTGAPKIHPKLKLKEIIDIIFTKTIESINDISRIQQEYLDGNFNHVLLQKLETLNNDFKNNVLKHIIFSARCAEIELCPIGSRKLPKKNRKHKKNGNHSTGRFQAKIFKLLQRIGENLLESLDIIHAAIKRPENEPPFDKDKCD